MLPGQYVVPAIAEYTWFGEIRSGAISGLQCILSLVALPGGWIATDCYTSATVCAHASFYAVSGVTSSVNVSLS